MESLASYIIRLTESNYYSSSGWIFEFSDLKTRKTNANLFNKEKDDLSLLSFISDVEESILWSMTFSAISLLYSNQVYNVNAFNSVILKKALHKSYAKFCPICLQTLPYYRLIWDLAFIKICPLHNCLLIDECQICHHKINVYRPSIKLCKCGESFCDSQPIFVRSESASLSLHVYKLCHLIESSPGETNKISESNPIMLLNLSNLSTLLYRLVDFSELPYIQDKFLSRIQTRVELFQHGCFFDILFSIIINWNHEFINIMANYEDYLASSYSSVDMINKKFPDILKLFKSMINCFPGVHYSFFRGVIEDYFWNLLAHLSLNTIKITWRKRKSLPNSHSIDVNIKEYNNILSTVAKNLRIKELTLTQLFAWSKIEIYEDTIFIAMFDYWLD